MCHERCLKLDAFAYRAHLRDYPGSDNKNPYGYCPDHGTGVSCPIGVVKASD